MADEGIQVSAYAREHRRATLELVEASAWAHQHLDWHSLEAWLDSKRGRVLLAWHDGALAGCIGVSRPVERHSWIRLLTIGGGRLPGQVASALWLAAESLCRAGGAGAISILMSANWLPAYFAQFGFGIVEDLITMSHIGSRLPAKPKAAVALRAAENEDLPGMSRVDRLAFTAPWRLDQDEMRRALRMASSATVAASGDDIVGFALSTRAGKACHLARLAVHPAHRRQSIAAALLHWLVRDCLRRGIGEMSVNTQKSNLPSRRLYERYGFFRNGKDHEMWQKRLDDKPA